MYLWYLRPGEGFRSALLRPTSASCPVIILMMGAFLVDTMILGFPCSLFAEHQVDPVPVQGHGKASSTHVGSAMAVLATLEQAQVLPPEGTREANHVIKSVIQFQSVFANSTDPVIQNFVLRALTKKHGEQGVDMLAQFRSSGWAPDVLQALAGADLHLSVDERLALTPGLGQFNVSVEDLQRFMRLVREAEQTLTSRGLDFHQVFASHRKEMPGATVH